MGNISELCVDAEEELIEEYRERNPNVPYPLVLVAIRPQVLDRATQKLSEVYENRRQQLLDD